MSCIYIVTQDIYNSNHYIYKYIYIYVYIYRMYQKKLDQNSDFNFLQYVQKVTFRLCNLVHPNIIKSLGNYLTFRITLTGFE